MSEDRARDISGPVISHQEFSALTGRTATQVRRTFPDPQRQERFERLGFCVVPALTRAQIEAVRAVWDEVGPAPGDPLDGFFPGNASTSADWKRSVIDRVEPIIAPVIDELFDRHHVFHLTFMAKWPGSAGRLQAHQDSTMVEHEDEFHALNLWCPLDEPGTDGHATRGMLRIVPGSHRLPTADWYRGRGGFVPSGFDAIEEAVYQDMAAPVPTEVGEGIAFDHRVVHCSSPNETDAVRLVLAIGLRPAETRNIHVDCDRDGMVDFYAVDDEYFIQHPAVDLSTYEHLLRTPRRIAPTMLTDDFERAVSEATGVPRSAPDHEAAAVVTPRPPQIRSGASHRKRRSGAVLADPKLDRRLRRDGFVVAPLISAEAAAALRAEFGRLRGWEGEGFSVDFWNPDLGYRHTADRLLAAATDDAFADLFVDYEPFLRNFLIKYPGPRDEDDFPDAPHRDWMYTDERDGIQSYVAWIALEDIDHDNGQFRVARGSHRIDQSIRGSNISSAWLDLKQVWSKRMLSIPVRSGHVVISHSALVHASYPNHSAEPRLAAAVALKPVGAPLVHHQRVDDLHAARFEISPEFFLTESIEDLMTGRHGLPSTAQVEIGSLDMDPDALARLLDRGPLATLDRIEARLRGGSNRPPDEEHTN